MDRVIHIYGPGDSHIWTGWFTYMDQVINMHGPGDSHMDWVIHIYGPGDSYIAPQAMFAGVQKCVLNEKSPD